VAGRPRRPPEWFALAGGPQNRRQLAGTVARESEYLSFYGSWSGFSHAKDASAYIRQGALRNQAAFLAVRSPHQMLHRAFLTVRIVVRATRLMIGHFREGEDLAPWYGREVRSGWEQLLRVRVVPRENERQP